MSRRRNPDLPASLHPALRAADGAPYFSDDALEEANTEGETYKSRTALVLMDPADFLRMADPGKEEARQVALERVLRAGTRLSDVPRLFVDYDKESGFADVTGHEGRHRSRSLLARGVKQMPVRIHTTSIRWSEQTSPRAWDYIEVLPHTLAGEGGHARNQMPMPVPIHYPQLAERMMKKNPRRMDGSVRPTRATQVNAYLAEHGFPGVMLHRDARDAYCHFYGGDADYWDETGVYVPRISDLTLDGWLTEARRLAQTKRNPRPVMRRVRQTLRRNPASGLLYHATQAGKNNEILASLASGIDPSLAKGFGQGAGFYLWASRDRAVQHLRDLISADSTMKKQVAVSGEPILVVLDVPVTPEVFDIDYEVFAEGLLHFVRDNAVWFKENADRLAFVFDDDGEKTPAKFRVTEYGLSWRLGEQGNSRKSMSFNVDVGSDTTRGRLLSQLAHRLSEVSPEMFRRFEAEALPRATALKYVGPKVQPLRIERLDGTALWSRGEPVPRLALAANPRTARPKKFSNAPLTAREEKDIGVANVYLMDWVCDGWGPLPPRIAEFEARRTPLTNAEKRELIDWYESNCHLNMF